jgi:hypothetical protein
MKQERGTMKVAINSVLTLAFLLSASTAFSQSQCFQTHTVSELGKIAFQELQKETIFAFGGVGYDGQMSSGEKAMNILLDESSAKEVLFELATKNGGVGGLYGLTGLKMIKSECFGEAYQQFLKLPDLTGSKGAMVGEIPKGYVETMAGCIVGYLRRTDIANEIAVGKYKRYIDFLNAARDQKKKQTATDRKHP